MSSSRRQTAARNTSDRGDTKVAFGPASVLAQGNPATGWYFATYKNVLDTRAGWTLPRHAVSRWEQTGQLRTDVGETLKLVAGRACAGSSCPAGPTTPSTVGADTPNIWRLPGRLPAAGCGHEPWRGRAAWTPRPLTHCRTAARGRGRGHRGRMAVELLMSGFRVPLCPLDLADAPADGSARRS